MKKYLFFAAAMLAAVSCSNDDDNKPSGTPVAGEQTEIRLTSGVRSLTQAVHSLDTRLKPGAEVSVWVDDAAGGTELYADNRLTVEADGKQLGGGEAMFYPASGSAVNIYAMYGSTPAWGGENTFAVQADQTGTDAYAASDLMFAKKTDVARTRDAVTLTFRHMLTKVEVALVSGAGNPAIAKAEIVNTMTTAAFTPDKAADFSVTATGEAAAITIGADAENEAVIVPQTLTKGTPFVRLTTADGGELLYTLADDMDFLPGKKYRYTITATLPELTLTAEVTDWNDGGSYNGDATLPEPQVGDRFYSDGTY